MNREDAKKELYYSLQFDTLNPNLFIDKLYNDFEKEKEIITRGILNKTCENCRNYINYHKVCREDVTFYKQKLLPKTFGCNKWVQNVI